MTHPVTLLRHAIRDALASAGTAAGANVVAARPDRVSSGEGTAIAVYTPSEALAMTGRGQPYQRRVTVIIHGVVRGGDPDDAADALSEEIEAVCAADPSFAATALRSVITSRSVDVEDGREPIAHLEITLEATVQAGPPAFQET